MKTLIIALSLMFATTAYSQELFMNKFVKTYTGQIFTSYWLPVTLAASSTGPSGWNIKFRATDTCDVGFGDTTTTTTLYLPSMLWIDVSMYGRTLYVKLNGDSVTASKYWVIRQ